MPIPTVRQTPFGPVRIGLADEGQDPSLITDFQGIAGVADITDFTLTGVGTDTTVAEAAQYNFNIDVRFMQGEFIGADGQHHQGTFAFV